MPSRRILRLTAFALSGAAAIVLGISTLAVVRPETLDDAMIVLVYARHLARGGGIYWNREEGRVDGYTSFLDMIFKAAATGMTHADPLTLAHCLSVGFFVLTIAAGAVIAFRSATRASPLGLAIPALGAVAFGANRTLAYATSYVLESSLYAGVALVALYLVSFARLERARSRAALAASWVLLVLVRPEGALLALVLAGAFVWRYRGRLSPGGLAAPCLALAGATALYYGWHLAYFGWLAPNTYYAKASDSRWLEIQDGVRYATAYFGAPQNRGACVLVVLPACALVRGAWSTVQGRLRCATAGVAGLVGIAGVVLSGGDGYPGGRLMAVPLVCLLAAAAIGASELRPAWRVLAIVPLAMIVQEDFAYASWRSRLAVENLASWPLSMVRARCLIEAETVLRRGHVTSLSQTDWQQFKLFDDDLRVVDLSGLNDVAIAHAKWPGQNLWGKATITPAVVRDGADVLLLGSKLNPSEAWTRYSTEDIVTSDALALEQIGFPFSREVQPVLIEHYVPLSIPVCQGDGFINVLLRSELAGGFAGDNVLIGVSARRR